MRAPTRREPQRPRGVESTLLVAWSKWAAGGKRDLLLRAQRALICGSKCRKSSGRCLPACSYPKENGVIRKRGETSCLPSCVPAAHSREYAVMIWHTRRAEVVAPYEIPRQFTFSRPTRYKAAHRTVKSPPVKRGHPSAPSGATQNKRWIPYSHLRSGNTCLDLSCRAW